MTENPKRREEDGVTFKIPNKYLLYAALAMGGGGTAWTRFEQVFLGAKTEQTDKAMYGAISRSLEEAHNRIDSCEGRLYVLEKGGQVQPGIERSGSMRRGAHRIAGGSEAIGGGSPESPPSLSSRKAFRLPSYEDLQQAVDLSGEAMEQPAEAAEAAPVEEAPAE